MNLRALTFPIARISRVPTDAPRGTQDLVRIVEDYAPINPSRIADMLCVSKPYVCKIARPLIADGTIVAKPGARANTLVYTLGDGTPTTKAAIRRQTILTALTNAGPMTPEQIAKRLGDRGYASIRSQLIALESAGKVERLPGGRYVVAGRMAT